MIRHLAFASAALLGGTVCHAQLEPPILLGGPEIAKVAWDSLGLVSADFDGDGRLDAGLVNNENAKIVLLYQRSPGQASGKNSRRALSRNRWEPITEDSRFEKVSIPTDQRHFALVAADFNGDQKVDLALTGDEDALMVRFQGNDGSFTKEWKWKDFEPMQGVQHLRTADLNGDGKADLAVLGKGKLLVFIQKPEGGFAEPVVYLTGEDRPGQLFAEDADGDRRVDLLYLAGGMEGTLRLRRQIAPGVFAAETALPYSMPSYAAIPSHGADGRLVLTRVNAKSNLIEQHTLAPAAVSDASNAVLSPTLYNLPVGMKVAAHTVGDFNGDGLQDLAVADNRAAQVALFFQQSDGAFGEAKTFPSFSGITSLAAIAQSDGKGAQLAVTSRKEGFGISKLNAQGRLDFPTAVQLSGEPVAVVASANGDAAASGAAVLIEQDRKWRLELFAPKNGSWSSVSSRELANLKREPSAILTGDLNGDGRTDLLLTVSRESAWIVPGIQEGIGEPLKETPNMRSQLSDLAPDRVALVDLDGDKRAEIVTSGTGFARSLKLVPAGNDVAVVDQFNARQPDNKLVAPIFADSDGDGQAELIFGESGSPYFQVLKKDSAGVYRATRRLEAIGGDLVFATAANLGSAKASHLVALSRDRFWTAPFAGPKARLELAASYDTDLQNCTYFFAIPADVNADGQPEILAFDRESQLLEILAPTRKPGSPWKSLMHFSLFEENMRFRGRKGDTNAREVITGDFTGDKRDDILVLVHDRVLLYPQG